MELHDLYDIHGQKTGASLMRGTPLPPNMFRGVVHICLFNNKGQMLIQKRVDDKDLWPSVWDVTAGGSMIAGENSQQSAQRELFEELGVEHNFSSERPYVTVHFEKGFDDYYLIKKEVDENTLTFQASEVSTAKWATCQEIKQMIDNKTFIPYKKSLIEFLFDCLNKRGIDN